MSNFIKTKKSSNDFIFFEIPDFNPEYKEKVETFKLPFTGKKENMLVQVTNPGLKFSYFLI